MLSLAFAGAAIAGNQPKPTDLQVDTVTVTEDGRVDVTGSLTAQGRNCKFFRPVFLYLEKPDGKKRELDFGVTSFEGGVWRLRSQPGFADKGSFFVKTPRVLTSRPGKPPRVACAGDKEPVVLPE